MEMNKFLIFIFIVIGKSLSSPSGRIIGGSAANIADFPYQCSLRYSGAHTCGCVILSPSKVLTAAHCVDGRQASSFEVYAGSTSHNHNGVLKSVQKVFRHEHYDDGSGTFANDIAVVVLSSEFDFHANPNIRPGDLAQDDAHDFDGEDCVLTGWGRSSTSNVLPDGLRQVTAEALSLEECREEMFYVAADIENMHLCVITRNRDGGSCDGDSGGPLNCGGKIAGVTSWGVPEAGECTGEYPSVYARVSHYYDWITSK